jgi:DHA1 family multidrug resistance protein-like MFS transporter
MRRKSSRGATDKASPSWKRNLWIIWFAEFTAIVGFAIAMPIFPFYVQELGISDPDEVKFWSGVVSSAPALMMAIASPIWGSLADRRGRKPMVVRAMFGGAVVMSLMGLAQNVQHLALLRAFQGMLTGTVAAATTLVASSAPRKQSGYALGMLQMAVYSGASAGPFLGGLIADTLGSRIAFWAAGGLLLIGGLLVAFLVREDFQPLPRPAKEGWRALRRNIVLLLALPLLSIFSVRLMMRTASRLMGPLLSLFVQELAPAAPAITLSGVVQGVAAAAGATGAIVLGRTSDRVGPRKVLTTCALALSSLHAAQFFVTGVTQLALLQMGSGLAMGGTLAAISATLATLSPEGREGIVYGIDSTIVSIANAVGPMVGTMLAVTWNLRAPFLAAAALFSLAGLLTARLLPHTAT